jgi:hypothetical protein
MLLQNIEAYTADDEDVKVKSYEYYADGLTPPTRNIVRRKFEKARAPPGKFGKNEVRHECWAVHADSLLRCAAVKRKFLYNSIACTLCCRSAESKTKCRG